MYLSIYITSGVLAFINVFNYKMKNNKVLFYILFGLLIFIASIRYGVGTDYFTYLNFFANINDLNQFNHFEIGLRIISIIFKNLGLESIHLFGVFALISIIPLSIGVFNNSYFPFFSFFIYFNAFYPNYIFNAVGQGITMGIFIYLIDDITKNNYKRVFIWSIIAFLFHKSGILILVAYLFSRIKFNYRFFLVSIAISLVLFPLRNLYSNLIINILPFQLEKQILFYSSVFKDQVTFIGLIQRLLILFPFINFYKKAIITKKEQIIFRMYFLGFIFYILFSFQGMFATRINMFFRILEIIMFPILIRRSKNKTTKLIFLIIITIWSTSLLLSMLIKEAYFPFETWL
jgi:hypothetical protein